MAKILIIDDSSMSRRILRTILEGSGHEIIEASDGLNGLEQYFLQKPDVVLLDLIMSGMFGIDVLKKILEMDPKARVVIATADIQSSTRKLTEEHGAAGFVTKPFTSDEVLRVLNSVLGGV